MPRKAKEPKTETALALKPKKIRNKPGQALTESTEVISTNPEVARFQIAKRIAHIVAHSALTPEAYRGRETDCFVAIQLGHSIGLDAFQSVQHIAVIDNRPCLFGDGLIGVVRRRGNVEWIKESYDPETRTATCETKRKGEPESVSRSFSWAEAERAGLTGKLNWKKYPERMLQMRARGWCLRDVYPDSLLGFGVAEEVMDYSDEPAPITEFNIPPRQNAVSTTAVEKATNGDNGDDPYQRVISAFDKATTMEELLVASNMASQLTSEADIAGARVKYRERKQQLQQG